MKVFDGDGPNTEDVAAERKARQKAMTARWRERLKGRGNKSELQVVAEDEPDDETAELVRFYESLAGKDVPVLVRIAWVANNLHIPLSKIDDDAPPDYGSITMLRWANENEDAFRQMYESKLIPSKQQLETADRAKDDGRALPLIDALEQSFYKDAASAESAN